MPTLHDAIDPETARALIAQGANVHAIDHEGVTPLLLAAQRNDLDLVSLLMSVGARPAQWCGLAQSPLDVATDPQVLVALTPSRGTATGREPSPPD